MLKSKVHPSGKSTLFTGDSHLLENRSFLAAADRIGTKLCRDAIWSGDMCNWMGWAMEPVEGQFIPCFKTVGVDFYSGFPGIALFLAELQKYTKDPIQKETVNGAVRLAIKLCDDDTGETYPGFYTGLMGVGYVLVRIGELFENPSWIEKGLEYAERAAGIETDVPLLDLLSGSAGIIIGLIDLAERYKRPDFIQLARKHGDILVEHAVTNENGVSWQGPDEGLFNLLGYSHGTAGIALALLELSNVVSDDSSPYEKIAYGALKYERGLYCPEQKNWPDLRPRPGQQSPEQHYPVAWCHGATGIGLSRLRLRHLKPDDPHILRELDAALQTSSKHLTTPQQPGAEDFSYCHGLSGDGEFLWMLSQQMDRGDIGEAVLHWMDWGISRYQGGQWPCGVQGAGENPGFMVGLAGIGYSFLRLHNFKQVPSMLLIQPNTLSQPKSVENKSSTKKKRKSKKN